jgi:hypothetical protein
VSWSTVIGQQKCLWSATRYLTPGEVGFHGTTHRKNERNRNDDTSSTQLQVLHTWVSSGLRVTVSVWSLQSMDTPMIAVTEGLDGPS